MANTAPLARVAATLDDFDVLCLMLDAIESNFQPVGSCGGVGGSVDHKRELYEQGEWGETRRSWGTSGTGHAYEQGTKLLLADWRTDGGSTHDT